MVRLLSVRMLEREGELQQLGDLMSEVAAGGRIALVSGEAGVGKSVLTTEFAERAGRRARVFSGACDPLTTPRALGPVHDLARQSGGPLAASLAARDSRELVFAALIDLMSDDRRRPTVVIIEDAHWADEATLDMLTFLGRRIGRTRALLVITFRDDEMATGNALTSALSTIPRGTAVRIPLAPLSAAAVTELAADSGREPDEVFDITGGNPLLVAELLASTTPGVPPTVRDLMLARLDRLSDAARQVAHLVSIVPGRADADLAAGGMDQVEACIAAGVLVPSGDGVAYRHELLRRAVMDSLSPLRRARLHATVLAALEADGSDPARLAHHAAGAGDVAALLRHAPQAAERATAVGAYREAAEHLRSVLPHVDRLPEADRAELLSSFAVHAHLTGAFGEGLIVAKQALELWERLGRLEKVGDVLGWIGLLSLWTGNPVEGDAAFARSIAVLETLPESSQLAMAYSYRAMRHFTFDQPGDAIEWGDRAIELAVRLGDDKVATHARITVASARVLHYGGDEAELEKVFQESVQDELLAEESSLALCYMMSAAIEHTDHTRAAAAVERALDFTWSHDQLSTAQYLLGERARIRLEQGDWTAATDDAVRSLEWPSTPGTSQVPALVALGRIRSLRGDTGALAVLDEAAAHANQSGELAWIVPTATARSEHFWLEGESAKAAEEVRQWIPLAVERDHRWFLSALAFRLWKADPTAQLPTRIDLPLQLLIDGDWRGAAAEWERRGSRYARAEVMICGDAQAATEALRFATSLGATKVVDRWRDELRHRGLRITRGPGRATGTNPAGLTARQLEVVALLAEGLTNPQIGQRLSMSTKTAGHHVGAVLDKLNSNTRSQAAATALRLGLLK